MSDVFCKKHNREKECLAGKSAHGSNWYCPECEAYEAGIREGMERNKEEVEVLQDKFRNGIKYDEENNQYILVWTEREIEQAKKEADEICEKLGILPTAKEGV
jgi:hypothetical protein